MIEKKKKFLFFIPIALSLLFIFFLNKNNKSDVIKLYSSGEKEIEYKGNDKNGVVFYFFKNGNVSKRVEQKYRKNDGKYLTFYESGELLDSAIYSKGIIRSNLFSFYKAGGIKSIVKINYKNKKDGMAFSFYENGQLEAKNFFVEDHMYYAKSYSKKDSTKTKEKIVPKISFNGSQFNVGDTITITTQLFDSRFVPYSSSDLIIKYDFGLGKSGRKYRYPTIVIEEKIDTSSYILHDSGLNYMYGSVFKNELADTLFEDASSFEFEINVK